MSGIQQIERDVQAILTPILDQFGLELVELSVFIRELFP